MILFLLALILRIQNIKGTETYEQCYADSKPPHVYFSSLTSYYASRGPQINVPEGCSPTFLWAFIRHGTRYPTKEFITSMKNLNRLRDEIIRNHENGSMYNCIPGGNLCENDLENLKSWNISFTEKEEMMLTPQGRKEHIFLAQKLKETFPNLLISSSKNSFTFQTSPTQRTKESAKSFTNALLNTNHTDLEGNNITINSKLLEFNSAHCQRYVLEIKNQSLTTEEMNLFQKSELMQKTIFHISNRLGFEQSLPYSSIFLMYGICAYETSWRINSKPPFCSAFLPKELKVFEYIEDLRYFYKYKYDKMIMKDVGCVLVKEMMISLINAANNVNENRKASFYFTHSEVIFPLIAKLGFNQDDVPLKHNNYERMKENRKWRTSFFNSFAANVIAVLYNCNGPQGEQKKVIFYQNERQVETLKYCRNPCTLDDLLRTFTDVLNETLCNFNYCEIQRNDPLKQETTSKENVIISNFCFTLIMILICRYLV